jgi:hypothetical protein
MYSNLRLRHQVIKAIRDYLENKEDFKTSKWNEDEDTTMDYIPTNTNGVSLNIERNPIATSTDLHQESTVDEVFTTKMPLTSTIQPFSDTTKSLTTNSNKP